MITVNRKTKTARLAVITIENPGGIPGPFVNAQGGEQAGEEAYQGQETSLPQDDAEQVAVLVADRLDGCVFREVVMDVGGHHLVDKDHTDHDSDRHAQGEKPTDRRLLDPVFSFFRVDIVPGVGASVRKDFI